MGIAALTPAMRQYVEIKEKYKDCILFYRMGDFYEMFFEDAVTASKILEITLTSRNKGKEDSVPLCGFPYHAASGYITKLIENGFKVAICEQVEDPKEAKGIVKREVVRIVTPGLVIDDDQLAAKENNFLAGIAVDNGMIGLAFTDISTGDFRVIESSDRDFFWNELASLDIREILVREDLKGSQFLKRISVSKHDRLINYLSSGYFERQSAEQLICETFHSAHPAGIDFESHTAVFSAVGAVLGYISETQQSRSHIRSIEWHRTGNYLFLDETAKRNLELFFTIQDLKKRGSLFHILDQTVTAMGGRRLRWWLHYPLIDPQKIEERLTAVGEIKDHHLLREELRKQLAGVYDLQRLGSRIAMKVANGIDLIALKNSLKRLPPVKELLYNIQSPLMLSLATGIDEMHDIADLIEASIREECSPALHDGGIIREGFHPDLDQLIAIMKDGKKWIVSLEEKERKRTGINSLKVGFNSVFGYYLEVTRSNSHLVPPDFVRKQTLVNAERYITQDLKELEDTVLNAEDKRKDLEFKLFTEIRENISKQIDRIQNTAARVADLDALASLAEVAEKYNYCRPFVDNEDRIEIRDGRHPVVERMPLAEGFVPNDTCLDCSVNRCIIITGPNMAGKSTYIRQVALLVIMAQMGSFVPASEARIGVADRVFTRVGAADNLARGQSTFMVEMTEVADILNQATRKSLILLDEVGRGTSTFDGLSIAWAIAEYIHDAARLGARTLFATHYHQLMEMALTNEGIKNYHVAVKEWGDRIIFLRKIVEGGTNRSYGIQVAKLAGVPEDVIRRAKEILANLEKFEFDDVGMPKLASNQKSALPQNPGQLSLFAAPEDLILRELQDLDLLNITPLEALNRIGEWKNKLKK